jgi:hypothetical protein
MPTIADASVAVKNYPNKFVSPYGNDGIVPLYSSMPLKSPVEGCLDCIVCGDSIVRTESISNATQNRRDINGVTITPGTLPGYPYFSGFVNPANKYSTVVVFDWDSCLFSSGIIDYSIVPILVSGTPHTSPPWPVDGHYKAIATGPNIGIIVESTGGYAAPNRYPIGKVTTLDQFVNPITLPNVIDDTHRYYRPNSFCSNPTGAWIQAVLLK